MNIFSVFDAVPMSLIVFLFSAMHQIEGHALGKSDIPIVGMSQVLPNSKILWLVCRPSPSNEL